MNHGPAPGERIPKALQAVFLASNRGREVNQPPPNNAANMVYKQNWFFQRNKAMDLKALSAEIEPSGGQGLTGLLSGLSRKTAKNKPHSRRKKSRRASATLSTGSCSDDGIGVKEIEVRVSSPPRVELSCPEAQSPQEFLNVMLRARGYSTKTFRSVDTGYKNTPTKLQVASHHGHLVELIKNKDKRALREILLCGLSANPCNAHGESLMHTVARLGRHEMMKVLLDCGGTVQICDDVGRTPLHDVCFRQTPCFKTAALLLRYDPFLLNIADARGALPLSYVRKDQWGAWVDFLYMKRDEYFPRRFVQMEGKAEPSPVALAQPGSCPVKEPVNALPLQVASMVAAGKLSPAEALMLNDESSEASEDDTKESDDEYDGALEEEDDIYGSDVESVGSWENDTLEIILSGINETNGGY